MSDDGLGGALTDAPTGVESNAAENFTEELQSDESLELGGLEGGAAEELTPAEVKKEIKRLKKLKVKFNGREYEEELPFEIDDTPEATEYMRKQIQLAKLSQSKSQEYSQLEGEVRSFVEELRKNPRKALSNPNIGVDLKQLASEILEQEIEDSQKSPEQLESEKLQRKYDELLAEREGEQEEYRTKEFERLQEQEFQRYDTLMGKALESSDLPKSPYIVKKMADYMILGIQNGMNVEPADVIPIVREEMHNDLKEMFAVMPAEVISQVIGKDAYDKVRKFNLSKARKGGKPAPATRKKITDTGKRTQKKTEVGTDGEKQKDFKDFFGV